MYEPILIAPFENSGLKKWYKPWITGPQAFPQLSDAYPRRGVVRKREGFHLLAPLPLEGGVKPPVQGLKNWIDPSSLGERLIAFSRTKSYLFGDALQTFTDVTLHFGGAAFSFSNGTNDYFWASNYAGSMWVTNNLTADHIQYWNITNNWSTFQPAVNSGGTTLDTALIILPYKGRLVVLNTTEGGTLFQNRARWSQIGTPYVLNDATHAPAPGFAIQADAWFDDTPGKGGFIDADTTQSIVSADIVKDTLIVFFQRSTWRLRYTGNETLPFIWERLNTQYGSEATYSNVAFDEAIMAFSRFGWIGSDTQDVTRLDLDIPDDSFAVEGTNVGLTSIRKVQGIRDPFRNFAYWTYVPIGQSIATQIYAYNFIDKSWTIFNPFNASQDVVQTNGINVFGSYRNTAKDMTWADMDQKWQDYNTPDDLWSNIGTGGNFDFPFLIGGDLQGNVYFMFEFFDAATSDNGTNFPFSITSARINPFMQQGHKARLGYVDIYCTTASSGEITLNLFVDDQDTPVLSRTVEIFKREVNPINGMANTINTSIQTVLPHGLAVDDLVLLTDIKGTVGAVLNNKQFRVKSVTNNFVFVIKDLTGNNVNTTGYIYAGEGFLNAGDNVPTYDSTYVRVFLGAIARMHQIQLTLSDIQLADPVIGRAQFELQGLVFWMHPTGRVRR